MLYIPSGKGKGLDWAKEVDCELGIHPFGLRVHSGVALHFQGFSGRLESRRFESELWSTIVSLVDPLKGWCFFQTEIKCLTHRMVKTMFLYYRDPLVLLCVTKPTGTPGTAENRAPIVLMFWCFGI